MTTKGGQLVAHGPVQALLPLAAMSRSNVYRVMPDSPTSMLLRTSAGVVSLAVVAQAAMRSAASISAMSFFMSLILLGSPAVNKRRAGIIPKGCGEAAASPRSIRHANAIMRPARATRFGQGLAARQRSFTL